MEENLAGTGSYARGDQPRSVPDVDGPAYDAMIVRQKAYNTRQQDEWWRKHPGFAESLVPVWGSAREAVADAYDGDLAGVALNGALAASDLLLAGTVAKGVGKGAFKIAGSHAWNGRGGVRAWMGEKGYLAPGQHGHHWAIPQNGWGKAVPDAIKNQPWNINPMQDPAIHMRMNKSWGGKPPLTLPERLWYGPPTWAKVGSGATVGHPAGATKAAIERDSSRSGRR